ncbi:hypothetical protein [Vibrio sp. ER1A]|uniref:hypothetical protein n=1 Tax=Vibrio sp. ER1A TaxID=1517681 RepID=UPI000AC41EC2|nr:hypothetical protein [Vibrio sp. ER1A]
MNSEQANQVIKNMLSVNEKAKRINQELKDKGYNPEKLKEATEVLLKRLKSKHGS